MSNRMVRSWRMAELLAGHEFEGMRNGDLARALNVSAATITADLRDLEKAGIVERVPHIEDRWRLGPKPIQMFRAHSIGMDRVRARVGEMEQRYSREFK